MTVAINTGTIDSNDVGRKIIELQTEVAATQGGLDGVVAGTVSASKAVVVDANKHIDTLGISASGLKVGASGSETTVSATGAELNTVAGVTAGTVAASKAVVVDASKNIGTFGTITAASLTPSAGTASVAPVVLASGTNLTTAAAGAVEFDGSAFYATAVASARQQLDAEQYCVLQSNFTMTDSASAQKMFNSSANGAVTLVAGKTYFFEGMYNLTNTGTTSHTWATVFGGTATFSTGTAYQVFGANGTTANTPAAGGLTGFFSGTSPSTAVVCTAASTSATEQVAIEILGTIVVNAGGTLIPQVKASAQPGLSGTPGVTGIAGSFFRIWEMSTAATVGNWS